MALLVEALNHDAHGAGFVLPVQQRIDLRIGLAGQIGIDGLNGDLAGERLAELEWLAGDDVERSRDSRMPSTVTPGIGTAAPGAVAAGGIVACARMIGDVDAASVVFASVAFFFFAFAKSLAPSSLASPPEADFCASSARPDVSCACSGYTALINANATADAMGVFLSFMKHSP